MSSSSWIRSLIFVFHLSSVNNGLSDQEKSDFMTKFFEWKKMNRKNCLLLNFGLPDLHTLPFSQIRRVILSATSNWNGAINVVKCKVSRFSDFDSILVEF